MEAATAQTLAGRLVLFLVLPVALWWGLDYIVPLSTLLMRDLFFPFISHPHLFAQGPWVYIANGFVAIVPLVSVLVGRRFSIWANIGVFLGLAILGSLITHLALQRFGYPFKAMHHNAHVA